MRIALIAGGCAAVIAFLEARHLSPIPAAAALYLVFGITVMAVWHRHVQSVSRLAGGVVLLLPALFTGRALISDRAYGPYDLLWIVKPFSDHAGDYGTGIAYNQMLSDLILQILPWHFQVRQSLAGGEWPLWNSTMWSGHVLAANAQSAPYDPVNLIGFLLPLDIATTFNATATLFLAAFFAFACAREFGCSEKASLIAAAGFMCSSMMTFWVGWPLGRAWTMLPFVLLSVRRLTREPDLRAAVLLTSPLVLLIVFGHPETALHVVAIGIVAGVFYLFPARREAWKPLAMAMVCGALALLLTAIFLLPFITALPHTWQYAWRADASVTPAWAASPQEVVRAMRATFIPYSGGATWLTMTQEWDLAPARTGSVILLLAAAAVALARRREVRFLLVVAAVTLLASWRWAPVANALHALPLFDLALNDRLGAVTALCLSLLAAIAWDAREQLFRPRLVVLAAGAVLLMATAASWQQRAEAGVHPTLLVTGVTAEAIGIAAVVLALSLRAPRTAFVILFLGLAGQRVAEEGRVYPSVPRKNFFPRVPLIDAIPRDPQFRVMGFGNVLVPNIGTLYGLDDVRGNEAMTLASYAETWPLWCPDSVRPYREVTDLTRPFLDFLGVRYVLAPRTVEPPAGWRVAAEERGTRLLENPRALPRVFVPRHIRYVDTHGSTLQEMSAATDFGDVAWIYTHDLPPHTRPNGDATLRVRKVGSAYEVRTESTADTRIVITEAAWPGWRAYIDGRRVRIQLANRSFLSVHVPAGSHRVRLVYLPRAFVNGRAITAATLAVLVLVALWRQWRRLRLRRGAGAVSGR